MLVLMIKRIKSKDIKDKDLREAAEKKEEKNCKTKT